MIYFYTQVIVRDRDQWLMEATSYLHVATRSRTWARFQRGNSEGLARELRGFRAGLAWGLIFFALRVASRQNTFDSNIAMPVLYYQSVKQFKSVLGPTFVGPGQGPNCLQRLSADDTSRQPAGNFASFSAFSMNSFGNTIRVSNRLDTD